MFCALVSHPLSSCPQMEGRELKHTWHLLLQQHSFNSLQLSLPPCIRLQISLSCKRSPASSRAGLSNLGPADVLRLQLPEAFTTTSAGQDFWELKSKNIWRAKVGHHCSRVSRSSNEDSYASKEVTTCQALASSSTGCHLLSSFISDGW